MNLISTIDFSEKFDAQSIYSSQLYGTFFSIYAVIDAEDHIDHYVLKSIKLYTINYKGVLNLEIENASFEPDKSEDDGSVWKWKLWIEVRVKATKLKEYEVKGINNNVFLKSNPNPEGPQKHKIFVERFVKPIHDDGKPLSDGKIFDAEFYYREGIFVEDQAKRKEHLPRKWPIGGSETVGSSGYLCPFALLHVK